LRFFERQAQARRASRRLLWLFALAVAAIVVAVNLACAAALLLVDPWMWGGSGSLAGFVARLPRHFFETNTGIALLFIVGGALLEGVRLREGGAAVASMLGASAVPADPRDAAQRRLRNVAQETAIAAGAPIPALYVLDDETAINACAAGHDARDAAVIVTRGALSRLTRDELQGVFAHEMAHVLHGDVRLNLRLSAYVFGVLIVFRFGRALTGYGRPAAGPARVEGRGGVLAPVAFVFGVAIMGVGAIGWVAARLLQAAVGRQREFMADATAVRFTRQSDGLGNALRKALSLAREGRAGLANPAVATTAHAWIVAPDRFAGMFATHPPLAERIRRIFGRAMPALPAPDLADPELAEPPVGESRRDAFEAFDGPIGFIAGDAGQAAPAESLESLQAVGSAESAESFGPVASRANRWPDQWHLAAAAARRPVAARRVVLALLEPGRTGPLHLPAWRAAVPFEPSTLEPAARQALFEIAAGTLRQDGAPARSQLLRQARRLIESDGRVTLLEFAHYLTLTDRLGLRARPAALKSKLRPAQAGAALALLIRAAVHWPGSAPPAPADELAGALERARRAWGATLPMPRGALTHGALTGAIDTIDALGPLDQALAVKALAAALCDECPGESATAGAAQSGQGALLRALCGVWGVPMPPWLEPLAPASRPEELPALEFAA
jgi:Zn-dependent protease with chaperone function